MKLQKQKEFEQLKLQKQEEFERIQRKKEIVLTRIIKAKEKEKTSSEQKVFTQECRQIVIKLFEQDTLLEEVLTAERIDLFGTQRCPKCHIYIQKDGGCSHMYCSRCHHQFTWEIQQRDRIKDFVPLLPKSNLNSMTLESVKEELYKVTNIGV